MTKSSYLPQMTSNPKNKGTLFSSTFKVEKINCGIWCHLWKVWAFCHFVTSERFSSIFMKQQNYHNSPGWTLIMKMSAFFLQLLKFKKTKCLYFLDQTSFEGDISFLSFCDFMRILYNLFTSHKMSKSSYLPQMTSIPKNKGTLFSSTFKLKENKVTLFFGLDIIWGRYELFVIFDLWGVFWYLRDTTKFP